MTMLQSKFFHVQCSTSFLTCTKHLSTSHSTLEWYTIIAIKNPKKKSIFYNNTLLQVAGSVGVWLMDNAMNYISLFFLFFVATQFNVLKQRVIRIVSDDYFNSMEDFDKISENMRKCYVNYNHLIHYVTEDNALYSTVYLVCAVVNVASTCVCLYLFAAVRKIYINC